jgi:hypothetical protein
MQGFGKKLLLQRVVALCNPMVGGELRPILI